MFNKIKHIGFLVLNFVLFRINTVFADAPVLPTHKDLPTLPGPKSGEDAPVGVDEVVNYFQQDFLPRIAVTVISLAIPLAVIFIIYGAIQFLTAYGNDEKLGNAKKTLAMAFIGLAISLLAYAIVQLVFYSAFFVHKTPPTTTS